MPFNISEYLLTDDLTVLLGLIAATVFLLNNLYKPQPLVHPILLGRQSDVGRARNPGESAIYRNYGTGLMGRFPLRPSKDVHNLVDLVRPEVEAPRTLWSTKITNASLQDRVAALGTGLLRLAQLQPQASTVLILLNDCIEFIIADLALASHSITSYTLSSPTLLPAVLESYPPSAILTHAFLLPQLLEHIYETSEQSVEHTIIVVGEPSAQTMASVASNI
jgi:long-chain acyl-CoA synthetase